MRGFLDKDDSVIPSNRLETKIDLAVDLTDELGLGYERGNVYATYYSADNLPDDDVLKSDLDDYLGMYDRLLKKIGVNEDMGEGDALPLYEDIAKSCAVFDGTFDGACADRTIYQGTGSEDFIGRNNTEYVPDKGLIIESEQEGVDLVADEKITSQSIDAVVKYEKRLLSNGIPTIWRIESSVPQPAVDMTCNRSSLRTGSMSRLVISSLKRREDLSARRSR